MRFSNEGLEIVVSVTDIFSSLDFLFSPDKSNFKEKQNSKDSNQMLLRATRGQPLLVSGFLGRLHNLSSCLDS